MSKEPGALVPGIMETDMDTLTLCHTSPELTVDEQVDVTKEGE